MTRVGVVGRRGAARAGAALSHPDYRRLLLARVSSQAADGLFMATALHTVVFLPERQSTMLGFALATALTLLPFSFLEPFAGVFVDRWRRRRLLVAFSLLRLPAALLTLTATSGVALVYAGMLIVFSAIRLFQATASAVVPRVLGVPDEQELLPDGERDARAAATTLLFDGNTIAAVAGSVALFGGIVTGSRLTAALGVTAPLLVACAVWGLASLASATLSSSLPPERPPAQPLGGAMAAVGHDLADGLHRIRRTPAALAPILTVAVVQVLQVLMVTVSLMVMKEMLDSGLATFSWLLGAGGLGVFLGYLTVKLVGAHVSNALLIGVACGVSALSVVPALVAFDAASLSLSALLMGVSYAWVRVPGDTLAQAAVPDRYRGRVFTVMDLAFNTSRVLGAAAAVVVVPLVGAWGAYALAGVLFLAWMPVTPVWLGRRRAAPSSAPASPS